MGLYFLRDNDEHKTVIANVIAMPHGRGAIEHRTHIVHAESDVA